MQTTPRIEEDSMGKMEVPSDALYGASTQRAVLNFPISGYRFSREFIRALGLVKWASAEANLELGLLDEERVTLISRVAEEMIKGSLDEHFPVDIFQTGSGTSTNMNANEVISNRCCQLAGTPIGSKDPVHPNDHVNMGQSSNDVIPTALHVAVGESMRNGLLPALERLHDSFERKALEFWDVVKIGRTHLMDATPIRLGQEFSGYGRQVEFGLLRVGNALAAIEEVALGGTAVGTGLNCHADFPSKVVHHLWNRTGIAFREARNHFEAQASKDGLVQASGQLKTVAVSLFKIANDIRWLGSGPRCGLGEITLPATQPGSSIMPGKINPVMCEMLMQVCIQVIGADATITWAGATGNFELNTMMPVLAYNILPHPVFGRDRRRQGALRGAYRDFHGDGDGAHADHRLRPGGGNRPGKRRERPHHPGDLPGLESPARRGIAAGARSHHDDPEVLTPRVKNTCQAAKLVDTYPSSNKEYGNDERTSGHQNARQRHRQRRRAGGPPYPADSRSHRASENPRQRPRLAPRSSHDGGQAPQLARLSQADRQRAL
jgi:fumarate hydratase class II